MMSLPDLKIGDELTIDGVLWEVTSISAVYQNGAAQPTSRAYWLKQAGNHSYYHMIFRSEPELNDLWHDGHLTFGRVLPETGDGRCYHDIKRYRGLREVEDYCTKCGKSWPVSWRDIKA